MTTDRYTVRSNNYIMNLRSGLLWTLVIAVGYVLPGNAQMFSQGENGPRPVRSLGAGYQWVDFQYNGPQQPAESFDYQAPAYTIVFTQPNMSASVAFGHQGADLGGGLRDLRLIDATLFLWGGLPLTSSRTLGIYLPVMLHSGYRSVDDESRDNPSIDAFNLTTLGLGTGLGVRSSISRSVQFQAQATPVGGLALRTLEGTAGRTWLIRGSAQLHFARLIRRYGLSIGYRYRYQRWNIDASDLFPTISDDLFDYKNQQHIVHVGINW